LLVSEKRFSLFKIFFYKRHPRALIVFQMLERFYSRYVRRIINISFILIDSRLKVVSVNTHDYSLSPRIVPRPIKIVSGG